MKNISKAERLMFAVLETITTISFIAFLFCFCWAVSKFIVWILL